MIKHTLGIEDLTKTQIGAIFAYLFRRIEVMEFRKYFDNGIAVKKKIDSSGYILRNCKLFAYAHWRAVHSDSERPKAKAFEVSPQDAPILRRLNLGHIPKKFQVYSLAEYKSLIDEYLWSQQIDVYIGKFISKKLRFLIKSYGLDRSDIEADLKMKGLYDVYRMYPFYESHLHVVNIAKGGIKRAGQDLIQEHTSGKRQKLRANTDGTFEHLHVALDLAAPDLIAPAVGNYVLDGMRDLEKLAPHMTPRAQRFLTLLSGQHDDEFSEYLGRDNDKASEKLAFEVYCSKVQAYMEVSDASLQQFFGKLRTRLSR
jgi:hypothetical protein